MIKLGKVYMCSKEEGTQEGGRGDKGEVVEGRRGRGYARDPHNEFNW